jgi:hypothetical protein
MQLRKWFLKGVVGLAVMGSLGFAAIHFATRAAAQHVGVGPNGEVYVCVGFTSNEYAELSVLNIDSKPIQVTLGYATFPSSVVVKSNQVTLMPRAGTTLEFGKDPMEMCPVGMRCQISGLVAVTKSTSSMPLEASTLQLVDRTTQRTVVSVAAVDATSQVASIAQSR